MKILGHINRSGLLVEMTRDELAKLSGVDWEHNMPEPSEYGAKACDIGQVHDVSNIYNRLRHQERVKSTLAGMSESLAALAQLVRTVEPIAEELTKQPEGDAP